MKLKNYGDTITVWITTQETTSWVKQQGIHVTPSTLKGKAIRADFGTDGLVDLAINGQSPLDGYDFSEFNMMIADLLADELTERHSCYKAVTGKPQPSTSPSKKQATVQRSEPLI